MKETSKYYNGGINFAGLLTIAFIVLKLCNVIAWSWWWVLAPLWIPIALVLVIALFVVIVGAIFYKSSLSQWKKRK